MSEQPEQAPEVITTDAEVEAAQIPASVRRMQDMINASFERLRAYA